MKLDKYRIISISIPTLSIILIVLAFLFIKPSTTAYVIWDAKNQTEPVNADIILKTVDREILPGAAKVQVTLDKRQAEMTVEEFIRKTGTPFEIKSGESEQIGFYGRGFTGNHTYRLTLLQFPIDREIEKGSHTFTVRIRFREKILYEKESKITIA